MLSAVNVLAVYVLGIVVEALMYELTFVSPYVESPVTCDEGRDRFGRVVILATDVVAARDVINLVSNNPLNVVVYTPLVTVPAFPEIEPAIVCENVFAPENTFVLYVFGIVVEAATYALISESTSRSLICDCVIDRFGRVVILATDVVAAS